MFLIAEDLRKTSYDPSLKSGIKPSISKELTALLAGNDDDEISTKYDELDKIIRDNHLKIKRFVFLEN